MTKNTPLKKQVRHRQIRKTKLNHFVEERITPPAEIRCGADNSEAEVRKANYCQMPTKKFHKIDEQNKVRSSNECWPKLIQICDVQISLCTDVPLPQEKSGEETSPDFSWGSGDVCTQATCKSRKATHNSS